VIHGFDFTHALEHVLKESMHLGMHTGIVHFSLGDQGDANILEVIKYVWAHCDYQPWGVELPMHCPQCVLEINRTVVVCLPTYISMHRTRVEFLVP